MDEPREENEERQEQDSPIERAERPLLEREDVVEVLAEILDIEDPKEKEKLISVFFSRSFSGPVPPPQILKGYSEAAEGGGKWLLDYTKEEQKHRHKLNEKELKYYSIGQYFGFILGLIGIAGGL